MIYQELEIFLLSLMKKHLLDNTDNEKEVFQVVYNNNIIDLMKDIAIKDYLYNCLNSYDRTIFKKEYKKYNLSGVLPD